jgi:hypothetical protein
MEISAASSPTWEAVVSKDAGLVIDAGTLFTPENKFSPGRLLIQGKTVAAAGAPESVRVPPNADRIDASRFFVTPGFIDPHIHGCGGVDVMEGSHESINAVSRILARHGTTSFLPTTVSSPPDILTLAVKRLGTSMAESFDGAEPVGIHLEGPFINAVKRGTHKASNVLGPDLNLFEKWMRASGNTVRLITIAPELDGSEALLMMAHRFGVTWRWVTRTPPSIKQETLRIEGSAMPSTLSMRCADCFIATPESSAKCSPTIGSSPRSSQTECTSMNR